jgi:hypothetical protein
VPALKWLIVILLIAVYALHQDNWLWKNDTLVFGVLPMGLAYHAFYSLLAAATMAFLVRFAWPSHLEQEEAEAPETAGGAH